MRSRHPDKYDSIFVMALQIIQRHDRIMPTFAVGEELVSFLGVLIGL